MDPYYYNSSSFYNYNPSSCFRQTNLNSMAEDFNYNFNNNRSDVNSSYYQYGYNTYHYQNASSNVYNENDSAYYSASDYSNYSLNGTFFNSSVLHGSSPNTYSEQSSKKRLRQESTPQDNETENSVEQSRKRAKVVKLGENDLNILKLANSRGDNQYICTICSIPFESKAKLLMHEHKYHNGGSSKQCPVCLKEFGNQANTLVHLRAHTQEKTFKCHQCQSSFCDSSTLKKHLRTHTGEKPYECHLCSKKFTQSGNLKRHLLVHQKIVDETRDSSHLSLENSVQKPFAFNTPINTQHGYWQEVPISFKQTNESSNELTPIAFFS